MSSSSLSSLLAIPRSLRRLGFGAATLVGGSYAISLYINDDFDDVIPPKWLRVPTAHGDVPKQKLVVLGSGWGAMSLIRKLNLEDVDLTVVSPRPYFFYTPLLAGSATGTVSHSNIQESVRHAVVKNGEERGRYVQATCENVDFRNKTVKCSLGGDTDSGVEIPYDKLVIAVGAQPATFGIKGVKENALFLKELEDGVKVRSKVLSLIEKASALQNISSAKSKEVPENAERENEIDRLLHFVVVGGGPTGTELCAELSDFLRKDVARGFPEIASRVRVTLVEGLPRILSMFDEQLASYAQSHLQKSAIDIKTNKFVAEVGPTTATIKDAKSKELHTLDYGMLVWAAGITTRPVVSHLIAAVGKEGGQNSRRGLVVDKHLRVKGTKEGDVYAIGDCAVSGLPPTAQVAAQQGKYLGRILRKEFQQRRQKGAIVTEKDDDDNSAQVAAYDEGAQFVVPEFTYNDKGKMAYIGSGEGVVEIGSGTSSSSSSSSSSKKGGDPTQAIDYNFWRSIHSAVGEPRIVGQSGFMIWRSVYFSMLLSARNRMAICGDWVRTYLFGRDITSPTTYTATNTFQAREQ
mmetsp:Transcript_26975/g.37375  ORF Transcript_26975/g.37375 Transcript_26975/m.37375 type:complete len:576 (-) Transcript_26975:145-1872(-)